MTDKKSTTIRRKKRSVVSGPHVRFQQQASSATPPGKPILSAHKLVKTYAKGKHEVKVLQGVDFEIRPGQFTAIVGQSGSGKSTLLHLLATLDAPCEGEVHFKNNRIDHLPSAQRDVLRNKYLGMVFQFYHLLPELSALENVMVPLMIAESTWRYWRHRRKHQERAMDLLRQVGLAERASHKPRELSGGEMQRAAIARALIAQPEVLLADEPTGNLDTRIGREIMEILCSLNAKQNLTIVMVTHDNSIAALADQTVRLVDGQVERL